MTRIYAAAMVAALIFAGAGLAHDLRPAYLELRHVAPDTFEATWKVPGRGGDERLGLYVVMAEHCVVVGEVRAHFLGTAYIERWRCKCEGGLAGSTIAIAGLSTSAAEALVRIEGEDGRAIVERLDADRPEFVVPRAASPFDVAGTYTGLGIEHIWLGVDHLLFVLALVVLIRGWRQLVGAITAFTVAHSLTLIAAALGIVAVPVPPLEATIAASIAFVAAEIIHARQGHLGLSARRPWVAAFLFGLLHGFGFASALSEVGLPPHAVPIALLFFNVGVEVGQLLFIAAALVFARIATAALPPRLRSVGDVVVAYGIGTVACYWLVERSIALVT